MQDGRGLEADSQAPPGSRKEFRTEGQKTAKLSRNHRMKPSPGVLFLTRNRGLFFGAKGYDLGPAVMPSSTAVSRQPLRQREKGAFQAPLFPPSTRRSLSEASFPVLAFLSKGRPPALVPEQAARITPCIAGKWGGWTAAARRPGATSDAPAPAALSLFQVIATQGKLKIERKPVQEPLGWVRRGHFHSF